MSVQLRNRILKSGAKSYYLDIHHEGKRWREFLKISISSKDPKRAELKRLVDEKRAQRELELLSENSDRIPDHFKNIRFEVFSDAFIKDYQKADIRVIISSVNHFKNFIKRPSLKVSAINEDMMHRFMEYLNSHPDLSGHTPHTYYSRFKRVLKAAKRKKIIKEMPTDDVRWKSNNKQNKKREIVTFDELQLLSNTYCGNDEVKKAFIFACYTGIGEAEARTLTWGELLNSKLGINRKKTGSEIDTPLSPSILAIAGKAGEKDELVFGIGKISIKAVNKNLKNWVARAKIEKNITFYSARHSFAVMLLNTGANLKTVADLMGHSNIATTAKYLNYIADNKKEAINKLPILQRSK